MTLNKESQSIQDIAKDAIVVQDACNLSGVVHSFLDAIAFLRSYNAPVSGTCGLAEIGLSTSEINRHPIVTLYVSKIASLNGTDCLCSDCMDAFSKAYEETKKLAGLATYPVCPISFDGGSR